MTPLPQLTAACCSTPTAEVDNVAFLLPGQRFRQIPHAQTGSGAGRSSSVSCFHITSLDSH